MRISQRADPTGSWLSNHSSPLWRRAVASFRSVFILLLSVWRQAGRRHASRPHVVVRSGQPVAEVKVVVLPLPGRTCVS